MNPLSIDIFCRVIDNFGDAGVCWRLARQLAAHPGCTNVRLYIDDPERLAHFQPGLDPSQPWQRLLNIDVVHWKKPLPDFPVADLVIEAFACSPDSSYVARMVTHGSLWINLEYLSAEPWVESFHAQPSLQSNGLQKFFFFPGFTGATGGLLREPGLLMQRQAWLAEPASRDQLYQALHLPEQAFRELHSGARQVTLFCYPNAPAQSLVHALQSERTTTIVLVPRGVCPSLMRGRHGSVHVVEIPFLDQSGFDHLLWSSDLNCVRGEDSLVRALWAGRPLLWHIYPQEENAHQVKLQAWLEASPFSEPVREVMQSWNDNDAHALISSLSTAFEPGHWHAWQRDARDWSDHLARLPDLVSSLLAFCTQKSGNG